MKLKRDFVLREIVGETILVPVGEGASLFTGLITMNSVGTFIWNNLSKSEDEIVELLASTYDVQEEIAKSDVNEFLERLREADIIE